jgi:hypothetical protein
MPASSAVARWTQSSAGRAVDAVVGAQAAPARLGLLVDQDDARARRAAVRRR